MKIISTKIPDVKIIDPHIFEDERGFFLEFFNQRNFEEVIGQSINFVQDNYSKSSKGVLRGLHYQIEPFSQSKLVSVVAGEIYDVVVDIRENSPYFGKWVSENLSSKNRKQIWIPKGFAHGFLTLSDVAEVLYKVDNYQNPKAERVINYKDPLFDINWPEGIEFTLSHKDKISSNYSI